MLSRHLEAVSPMPGAAGGFTLIELMITVVVVAILAAIAYPAYLNKVRETRRSDGETALMKVMQAEQRNYTMTSPPKYTTDLASLGFNTSNSAMLTSGGWYKITAAACGAGSNSCVKLTAAPQNDQTNDTDCGKLTLDSRGQKGSSGGGTDCW